MNVHRLNLESTPAVELNPLGAEGQPLPARVKLLNWGDNQTLKGLFRVGQKTLTALSAMQKKLGFDRVALDFEHNTLPGTTAFKEAKEPRPVAAFGVPEVVEGEGLFLTGLNWTPEGEKNARNFLDLSAVPSKDETDEVVFVHSAALCRQGATPGMHLFALAVELAEVGEDNTPAPGKPVAVSPGGSTSMALIPLDAASMAAVVDAVGTQLRDAEWRKRDLDETRAALERAEARNNALQTTVDALVAQIAALKLEIGSLAASATPVTALTALTADVSALRFSLSASQDKHERDVLLLTARTQGKLIPLSAEGLATASLATLRDLVANAKPGQVPMHRLTPLNVGEPLAEETNSAVHRVARACGLDPSLVAKQRLPGQPPL